MQSFVISDVVSVLFHGTHLCFLFPCKCTGWLVTGLVCTMAWYSILSTALIFRKKVKLRFWYLQLRSQENVCIVSLRFIELLLTSRFSSSRGSIFCLTGETFRKVVSPLFFLGFLLCSASLYTSFLCLFT